MHHAIAGIGQNGRRQVVAHDRAFFHLAVDVGDVDIALDQHVDGPGNLVADAAETLPLLLHDGAHEWTSRHIHGRQCPTTEHLARMGRHKAALILMMVAVATQDTPRLGDGDLACAFDDVVGYLGPSILKSIPCPFGRVFDQLFNCHVEWDNFSMSLLIQSVCHIFASGVS